MIRPTAILLAILGVEALASAQEPVVPRNSAEILQELAAFQTTGRVLLVAAHPDDEDSQLIAYLARGRGYRTAYLSLNRGEGGQNLIGPEFGDELGVIRAQELFAARRIDGAQQLFTRARDFGYSKDFRDTLRRWDHPAVLADVVRAIRIFRPDVVITRFSPEPGATHGHHTASAVLALEAFRLAGDPGALPDQLLNSTRFPLPQLRSLAPTDLWQPKRVVWDIARFGGGPPPDNALALDIGGYNPILGESYGEIAARSRSMHRTQGFGSIASRGSHFDYFRTLAGAPPKNDIFDGIDCTWNRYPGGDEIARLTDTAIGGFNPRDPSASVPVLLAIRAKVLALDQTDPAIRDKRRQLDRILQACLGLYVESTIPDAEIVPGDRVSLKQTVVLRSRISVVWEGNPRPMREAASVGGSNPTPRSETPWENTPEGRSIALQDNVVATRTFDVSVAGHTPTQPYWLTGPESASMYSVVEPALLGGPDEGPSPIGHDRLIFSVGGQTLEIPTHPVAVSADPARGEERRSATIIPPVSLAFDDPVSLVPPGGSRSVIVEATAARSNISGILRIEHPAVGWFVLPVEQAFHIPQAGQTVHLAFTVHAPDRPGTATLGATVEVDGVRYNNRRVEIHYDHIPFQVLQPPAELRAVCVELAIRGRRVGYLPGAGDDIPAALARMGYAVTLLAGEDLTPEHLRPLDAVVIGIRAFNTRDDLAAHLAGLFAYVGNGGTVVEQYNTPYGFRASPLGPYPLGLDRNLPAHRVTDENAPVTLLVPDAPALTGPNRIGPADFDGWVQERGLNFPAAWDPRYTALLSCHDPGEKPLTSALLVARYGRGTFVVTGLSFFRQLPAGVPGAYRLFANLVSLRP